MAESTIWDAVGPLFEGRTPFLVVPAAIILVLALVYGTLLKSRAQTPWYKSVLIQAWPLIAMEVVNLVAISMLYTCHDDPPLTVETPSKAKSQTVVVEARLVTYSVICAAITAFFAQIGILPIYFRELKDHESISKSMLFPAVAGFVLTITSILTSDYFWPWRTFTEQLMRGLIPAYLCFLSFDTSLFADLRRLRGTAASARETTLDRLARAAEVTFVLSFACIMLVPAGIISGVPRNGWFITTLGLGGFLTIAHAHVVTFFVMWRAVEDETGVEGSVADGVEKNRDVDLKSELQQISE
ncbi:hypothetical protein PsYK624_040710 [Phanerochaete sordida]|uniref:Uncharacterized protein n=1 Tax=Phanerochaete sordida TaxID=48140 RepID=A0A9P3LBF2_9APHY|nr:hypothetical protein PsYK624_040710 [Phanerochaete sordida]